MKSVCFTGHRHIVITEELQNKLTKTLKALISDGATDFYAGGSYGFDLLCEKTILKLKKEYPKIKLTLILPCSESEQTEKWTNKNDIADYRDIINAADSVEIISEHYTKSCIKKRNSRLVELGDICVSYYRRKRSGTGQTVRMAEKKGISVINLYAD